MTFNMPAIQALISELVGPRYLMNAIALSSAGMNLTRIAAPTLAGVLIAAIGMGNTYFVYAATYVVVVMFLWMLPRGVEFNGQRQSPLRDAIEGVQYLRDNKIILVLMILATVPAIFAMPYMMMLPVYARDILAIGPEGMGIMMGATGIGALIGSLVVASLGDFEHKGRLLIASAVGFGLAIVLFANSTNVPLSLFLLGLLGMASTSYMAMNQTIVQSRINDEIRGRVMGIYMMSWGLMPLGTLPAGFLGDIIGVPMTLTLGGLIMAGSALFIGAIVPELRRLK
jgi:predicted MFS family arabinose efflux permease